MSRVINFVRAIRRFFQEKEILPICQPTDCNLLLKNKVILITGGTGGIGFAIAKTAVKCGGKVILCGTNEKKLHDYCTEIGEGVKALKLNLADVGSIEYSIECAIHLFSEERIDVLINAAGVHNEWDFFNPVEEVFDQVMDINVKGMYFVTQAVAKQMINKKIKGHILNVSSSSALRPAWTPYQISKWAVNGMTKGFADYLLPYGITVNAIAPGPTATEMVKKSGDKNLFYQEQPSHRYLTPEEVANLAVFMISSMGDMIVGDTYYITGGSGTISYHR